ncbi:hypothetical protein ACFLY4_10040 [Chloroflexota bacterium]
MNKYYWWIIWGVILVVIGCAIVYFASPIFIWLPVKVESYHLEFAFPHTWFIDQGEDQKPDLDLILDEVGISPIYGTDAGSTTIDNERVYYTAELYDATGYYYDPTRTVSIYITAYPLDINETKAEHLALVMQRMKMLEHEDYKLLSFRPIKVDDHAGYQQIDSFTEECSECPNQHRKRIIGVATYIIHNEIGYYFSLVEEDIINILRDYKIYRHLLETVQIY